MAKLTNAQLQDKLDVKKWIDSEEKGADTCGEYEYCSFCEKTEVTPCAKAYNKANKPAAKKPAAEKPVAEKKTTAKKTVSKKK